MSFVAIRRVGNVRKRQGQGLRSVYTHNSLRQRRGIEGGRPLAEGRETSRRMARWERPLRDILCQRSTGWLLVAEARCITLQLILSGATQATACDLYSMRPRWRSSLALQCSANCAAAGQGVAPHEAFSATAA